MKLTQAILCLFLTLSNAYAFDHSYKAYGDILEKTVSFKGPQSFVNYKLIKASELSDVLKSWEKVSKKDFKGWSSSQKLAFLINVYNGFTLKLIIDHYPVESIKDIGSFFSSPWKKKFFTILGKKSHLDYVEHTLIRKNFEEPRIHFAVNCASLGCPSLLNEPFVASKLDEQLAKAAKTFILNQNRNRFDTKTKTAYLSKIFKWYGDDFEEMTDESFKEFIKKFVPQFDPKTWDIEWLDYDWNLNQAGAANK